MSARLEDIKNGASVRGVVSAQAVQIVSVDWIGDQAINVVFRDHNGTVAETVLYRDDEHRLEVEQSGRPWSFDADGELLRLVTEANRIKLAHYFDPYLAIHTSLVDPLPHQISAVYGEMLPRQPLRFLLADDPGAGKTIMAGLFIKELIARSDLERCLVVAPGSLVEQWQDELGQKFNLEFDILTRDMIETSRSGNPFSDRDRLIVRLDVLARNEELQEKLMSAREWDLIICDEAHRMSATYFGGEVKYTRRYQVGQKLGQICRHLLLMSATPHNGKEEDFQLFMALLDGDRFEGRFRDGVHYADTDDMMRRLTKEELLRFDGRPLFPPRRARTVKYQLSEGEAALYTAVTEYVRNEMNRVERFAEGDNKKRNNVGFALQILQRRLASSPAAIYQSLKRRRERLENELAEARLSAKSRRPGINEPAINPDMLGNIEEYGQEEVDELEDLISTGATTAETVEQLALEVETLKGLESMALGVLRSGVDTKWTQLNRILDDDLMIDAAGNRRKLIIFTEPKDTLHYLLEKVRARLGNPEAVDVIHGGVTREERRKVIERFMQDKDLLVLIANDAAGEGVNLQRGHLMVNYDLPWNPNKIEQRFGRIHRIGQTEVCHLWNLVAADTREGEVYARLLEKLEAAREALGGRVYDVMGELFEGTSLKDLLFQAIQYGEREDVKAYLFRQVDGAVDQSHLLELLRRRALTNDTMPAAKVEELRLEMERAEAQRLQPHHIQSFFVEAFQHLGGRLKRREEGRWEVTLVPVRMRRLMEAISAGETAEQLSKMRDTILRTKFTELQRNEERRKTQRLEISVETVAGLLPWREVVEPHQDVATGEFQQAEFAADLAKVHSGSAPAEYRDPRQFFSRTYLTEGLSAVLIGAAKRLSGSGGDPVVELQTNFGGGKTHSMLALYHMAGPTPVQDLSGLDQLLEKQGFSVPEGINRAVLVGTSRGPQDVLNAEGGRKIRTTWGELAWQLGGAEAFDMIAENDANGIAPGSNLLEAIFKKYAPCLILIDEWVAYLRQIYRVDGLPSGSFDANLSFVQALTEAVKASPRTLLVASLPASQIEVGGEGGQEALARLKQTFSRVESSWRPASQEESYEIVRRRLFKEISGDKFHHRDNTLKQFAKLYRENANDFPQGCADEDYRRKLEKAYPIHPELFDQLYTTWGSLEKFQRTRGVLRLMAQAIHELWMNGDPSVMIMPGSVAVSSPRVEPELLHYLDVSWQSIIAGDVDGTTSTPYKIDQSAPNLNRYSATRRVARAIFMGTAPTHQQQNTGLDDKQINLGVVQPGERPSIFGDALRRLTNQAKFMHADLGRYWYSMSASLNRIAADRAAQLEDALVAVTVDRELTKYVNGLADRGHFDAVQVAPASSAEVPDEAGGVRAVVLGVAHSHNGRDASDALKEAKDILMQRGSTPRVYRNMLVFIAADARQLDNLKDAVRASLAWGEIVRDTKRLNLTQSDSALAEAKLAEANETMKTRLKEAWCYLHYPAQESAQADVEWVSGKIPAQDGLLARATKKLVGEEGLLTELGPARLDRDLQKYIWNGKPHLSLKDLREYLNRYIYLPRLKNQEVLIKAVQSAVSGMLPGPFAYAERWDEKTDTYLGLAIERGGNAPVVIDSDSVIIKPDVAEAHRPAPPQPAPGGAPTGPGDKAPETGEQVGRGGPMPPPAEKKPTRFTGVVMISPERPARDIHQIVEAIVEQLTTLPGSQVKLRLEIEAEVPGGLERAKVRTLIENANTLGFVEKSIE